MPQTNTAVSSSDLVSYHPTLDATGTELLRRMREHPCAPILRNQSGSRLQPADIDWLGLRFADVLGAEPVTETPGDWYTPLVDRVLREVPRYRRRDTAKTSGCSTTSRAELSAEVVSFVPDDVALDGMIAFVTSGTTGHPLRIPSHPTVAALYLAFHRRALRRAGLDLRAGPGEVGVVLLGMARRCFTYVSVTPMQQNSGLAKVNLEPGEWRTPDDRRVYLEALNPEIIAGDPVSFVELLKVAPAVAPRALFSTSMALSSGLRNELEQRFNCPVLDFYSMNEAGPIAVFDPDCEGHVLLQPELFVEIVDENGIAVADGTRGEITLTGGFNHFLPLLRYRTGDFASLRTVANGERVLCGLVGRSPGRFRRRDGSWLNNLEVIHALGRYPLAQYSIHQRADESLAFAATGDVDAIRMASEKLRQLLPGSMLAASVLDPLNAKVKMFTTDLACGLVEGGSIE